ncbi:Chloride channel protein A [Nymphon striatum]|nr:Chloride channel protein A [Nymphon striatum]
MKETFEEPKAYERLSSVQSLDDVYLEGSHSKDTSGIHPDDSDNMNFFASGRDFESAYVNHQYTESERKTLGTYESLDYLPPHSKVYCDWLRRQPPRFEWDRWVMMGLIGFTVGFVGFLMHQFIDIIAETKWDRASEMIRTKTLSVAWIFVVGYSVIFAIASTFMIVILRPSAGGSGIPELIGYLNGTLLRHIFNFKTIIVKFLSCVCAVGSGLPVGPEGPMIHLGSMIGAGLSQFRSTTLKIDLPFFNRFRNSEDRRNFISAGAAAGVSSAFGAPVGGLLFAMEEVSSFWNTKLSWQTFFCCMVSTFTTDLLNSAFTAFRYDGDFGLFKTNKYILFAITKEIDLNIIGVIPAALIGALGGIFGSLFTFLNLKIQRARRRLISKIKRPIGKKIFRMSEPVLIMIIFGTLSVLLPHAFECTDYSCPVNKSNRSSKTCVFGINTEKNLELYSCPESKIVEIGGQEFKNGSYNQVATLLFLTGESAIGHLFSRNTHYEMDLAPLAVVFVVYFILACWAAGSSISSGLVVPML